MSEYGLPTQRTGDDTTPDPIDHEYEWKGETVKIKLVPPTLGQAKKYENLEEDAGIEDLEEMIDEHIVKPDIPAADMTMEEINCYTEGIFDHSNDGGGEITAEAQQYLDEHAEGGNAAASSE